MNYNKILGGKKCNEEGYYCTNKQTPLGKRGCKSNNTGKKSKICDCLQSGDTYRCGLSSKNKKSQNYKVKIIELEKENKTLKHRLNESKKIIQRLLDERRIYITPVLSKKTEEYKKQKNPEQYKQYQNTLEELKKDKEEYKQNINKQNINKQNILDKLKEEKKIKNQKIEELKKKLDDVRARKRQANI